MAFFQPAPSPPRAPARKNKITHLRNEIDEFLSSDLELSFASTMSLSSPTPSGAPSPTAMDISPDAPMASNSTAQLSHSGARLFGRDLVNGEQPFGSVKNSDTNSKNKARQRAALPTQWMAPTKSSSPRNDSFEGISHVNAGGSGDAMDVDTESSSPSAPNVKTILPSSPSPAPVLNNPNYSNLFFDVSPETHAAPSKKRRSTSPPPGSSQSSDPPSSPSTGQKFSRAATIGVGGPLFKSKKPALEYNAPSINQVHTRRPTISAIVDPRGMIQPPQSAYPIMNGGNEEVPLTSGMPPPRRAFSAMIAPGKTAEQSSDDFSDGQSSSPAAAYAKRHQSRVIRRCDGSEDLRPINGAGSLGMRDREQFQSKACSPRSLAAFGVKEVEKKILPCHRVSEDGLVRITPSTLRDLLEGTYSSKITSYTVVDCRFDYEYAGGHIPGAVNLNTLPAVEEYFLGEKKPEACESGDTNARDIVVFHCEFSIKRAPTFAKHIRAKDRAINGRVYPKVCYPEMYILEGGYSQFYKEFPTHCDPSGYTQMDDPAHIQARDSDMDNFRRGKWLRTQSYTYGQSATGLSSFPLLNAPSSNSTMTSTRENRKTAPSGGPGGSGSMFAAANAARGRRTTSAIVTKGLSPLDEDASSSGFEEGDSLELHDSPCPPPSKSAGRMSMVGSSNRTSRSGLDRAVSFGPTRR